MCSCVLYAFQGTGVLSRDLLSAFSLACFSYLECIQKCQYIINRIFTIKVWIFFAAEWMICYYIKSTYQIMNFNLHQSGCGIFFRMSSLLKTGWKIQEGSLAIHIKAKSEADQFGPNKCRILPLSPMCKISKRCWKLMAKKFEIKVSTSLFFK